MLGCRVLARESLVVHAFGGGQERQQGNAKVEVGLAIQDGSMVQITAYEIHSICGPPPVICRAELRQYEHLRGLNLAEEPSDASMGGEEVEILIGQDFLQDFFDSRISLGQWPSAPDLFGFCAVDPTVLLKYNRRR